jgi:predicted alpha/beta hydrolase
MRRTTLALAAGTAAAGALAWRRHLATLVPELGGEPMAATTDDGWNLSMRRYRVPAGTPRRGVVVAGHGFAGTSLIWDLTPSTSLARHLAAAGWELFAVDLRGRGGSWPAGGPSAALQWSFDDIVRHDLPTAVAAACDAADVDAACWLGLEMSGQAAYAALIEGTAPQVHAAITLGSPVLTPPDAKVPGVTSAPMARRGGRVLIRPGAHHFGPVLALLRSQQLASSFRPELVDPVVPARYLAHGVPDESVVLAEQFRDWVDNATMRSLDKSVVWSDRMDEVQVPLLVMAAARDLQRPPSAVRASVGAFGSDDVELCIGGVEGGMSVDHGHDDLVAARTSAAEVFPVITGWLERHTGVLGPRRA